jgi:hypothetical protein
MLKVLKVMALMLGFVGILGVGRVYAQGAVIAAETRISRVVVGEVEPTQSYIWPLKKAIVKAIDQGVPANTIVILLMFPLVAALVAFSRQVVGLSGFGILVPSLVSVAFLSTGVWGGLVLFGAILITATLARMVVRKIRLPYLPRMAVLIWAVALGALMLMLLTSNMGMMELVKAGIFPVLLFTLLAESFVEAQITRTFQAAAIATLETIVLAVVAYWIISAAWLQSWVLSNPEAAVLSILLIDLLIGRYKGLRLSEVARFRPIIKWGAK